MSDPHTRLQGAYMHARARQRMSSDVIGCHRVSSDVIGCHTYVRPHLPSRQPHEAWSLGLRGGGPLPGGVSVRLQWSMQSTRLPPCSTGPTHGVDPTAQRQTPPLIPSCGLELGCVRNVVYDRILDRIPDPVPPQLLRTIRQPPWTAAVDGAECISIAWTDKNLWGQERRHSCLRKIARFGVLGCGGSCFGPVLARR